MTHGTYHGRQNRHALSLPACMQVSLVSLLDAHTVIAVACGSSHTLALTKQVNAQSMRGHRQGGAIQPAWEVG